MFKLTPIYSALCLFFLAVLSGCASLAPPMDPPRVSLESFKSLPAAEGGGGPRFEIKLRIQNPNEQTLDISGISYSVELLGRELISGVSNDVPEIEGYSEGVVTLDASLQLFQLLKLLASLGQNQDDALEYRLSAKIDFKGLVPTQRVYETGTIDLK